MKPRPATLMTVFTPGAEAKGKRGLGARKLSGLAETRKSHRAQEAFLRAKGAGPARFFFVKEKIRAPIK